MARNPRDATMTATIPQIRCPVGDRALIDAARRHTRESISNFVREAAVDKAKKTLTGNGIDPDIARSQLLAEEAEAS